LSDADKQKISMFCSKGIGGKSDVKVSKKALDDDSFD
jgi:hypothetical protein